MRKKKRCKTPLTYEDLLQRVRFIFECFYQLIPEKEFLQCELKEIKINNKQMQQGISFVIKYKCDDLASYILPYNKNFLLQIDKHQILLILFEYFFLKRVIKFKASIKEQKFILDHFSLLELPDDDLPQLRKYFQGEALDQLNSIILLKKLK